MPMPNAMVATITCACFGRENRFRDLGNRFREKAVVDRNAHIGLVDVHAERDGGNDDLCGCYGKQESKKKPIAKLHVPSSSQHSANNEADTKVCA